MNTTLVTNVAVMAAAIAAINKGLEIIYAHDYLAGGISVAAGIILLVVYEKLPTTPTTQ